MSKRRLKPVILPRYTESSLFKLPKRVLYGLAAVLLLITVVLVVWQGSFSGSFGSFGPDDPSQTFIFYGISILIFLLMMALGFMLVRLIVKLWIEGRADRAGSRIRTKLVLGALALSLMPVFFMVLFNYYVLTATMQKWFNRPEQHELVDFQVIQRQLERQTRDKAEAEAELLMALPETQNMIASGIGDSVWLETFCKPRSIVAASVMPDQGGIPIAKFGEFPGPKDAPAVTVSQGPVRLADFCSDRCGAAKQSDRRLPSRVRSAQLAKESDPLELPSAAHPDRALCFLCSQLAGAVSGAADQPSDFGAAFGRRGSEPRQSEPSGESDCGGRTGRAGERVQPHDRRSGGQPRRNRSAPPLHGSDSRKHSDGRDLGGFLRAAFSASTRRSEEIFPGANVREAGARLEDLFSREDTAEIRYLMNRARRTGHATSQLEVKAAHKTLHLAITVSAIMSSAVMRASADTGRPWKRFRDRYRRHERSAARPEIRRSEDGAPRGA